MNSTKSWVAGLAIVAMAGCASTTPALQTGPDAEVTHDGLTRVDNTGLSRVWIRDDLDMSRYTKIRLQGAGIHYSADTLWTAGNDQFPISQQDKERFRQIVRDAFITELSKNETFELVTEPGPDVLYVRGAIIDVVSRVPPARTDGGATDVWVSNIGEATLVIELYDSQSEQILARAADRQAAQDMSGGLTRTNAATTWSEVRLVAQRWASALSDGLEELASGSLTAQR